MQSCLPLRVRGKEGGYFLYFHNSPYPSYLKRGNFKRGKIWKNLMKSECLNAKIVVVTRIQNPVASRGIFRMPNSDY